MTNRPAAHVRPTTSWSGRRVAFPTSTRRAILRRDGHRCVHCQLHDPTGRNLVADHIVPVAEGGTDRLTNGQTLCVSCHDVKTRDEAARGRARMPRRQRPPTTHPGIIEP